MYRASARVTCLLTLDCEQVAEMHVPLVDMAFVAIRLPHLGGFAAKNTCQRDDERKAFHPAPPRNYPRPTPPRRRGIQRNDAGVCSEQTTEGKRRRRPGSRAPRPAAGRLMESDRDFKNKRKMTMKKTQQWPHFAAAGRKGQGTGRRADGSPWRDFSRR